LVVNGLRIVTASSFDPAPAAAPLAEVRPELADVGRLGRSLVRGLVRRARAHDLPSLTGELRSFLGPGASGLPVLSERWPAYEHVNVALALDAWLAAPARSHRLLGVTEFRHSMFGLAELLQGNPHGPRLGSVALRRLPTGPDGASRPCVVCGVYLVEDGDTRLAVLLRVAEGHGPAEGVIVEVAAINNLNHNADGGHEHETDGDGDGVSRGAQVLTEIGQLALSLNVHRGQVLSFDAEVFGPGGALLTFLPRPELGREALVLAPGVLDAIEQQVLGVARHRVRLRAAGQHLKRGLLLHGPPGTGKTHTVRYLLSRARDVTVVVLSGQALHLLSEGCSIARALEPSIVVVEDVDLIGDERGMHPGQHPMLFELLNQMDGLGHDLDITFLLTTNRADLLERALADRPGRVDLAVEIGLPDAGGRKRLLDLYAAGLELRIGEQTLDEVVARTAGVTASFLKELLRQAALASAERAPKARTLTVTDRDLTAALDRLSSSHNQLTRVLLGGGQPAALPASVLG
jgi:hypothetical protein